MTPLGFLITLSLAGLVFLKSRRVAAIAMIAAVCYMTQGQVLNVAGFHFTSIRLILLAGFIRVLSRGELKELRLNAVDHSLVLYAFAIAIISTLRIGTVAELVYRLGVLFDVLLSYFAFRCFIREERDLREVLAKVSFVIIPFGLAMVYESATARNPFALLGGVYEYSWIRDGHVRAAGAFRDPITAGSFGATFVMLLGGGWFAGMSSRQVLPGLAAATAITLCSRSSGPLLGLALGVIAFGCWKVRRHTGTIRWSLVAALIFLQLVMKVPLWFLISRAGDVFGGGGWHRAELVQQFINHFNSWWLAGTSDTGDWFPYVLEDGKADLTNRFVMDGVDAGLIGLILSVLLVVRCFQRLGLAMSAQRGNGSKTEKMLWVLGSTVVGTVGILFSVTYFDQMEVMWFFLLACVAGVRVPNKKVEAYRGRKPLISAEKNRPSTVSRFNCSGSESVPFPFGRGQAESV
jgi:hypothetical protein